MGRRRAFTLVEMLFAATLSLLVLGLTVSALVPILQYSARTTARSELLQAAELVAGRLSADLQTAPMAGLYLPDPTLSSRAQLSINGIGEVTANGLPVWDSQVILYDWESSTNSLTRKLWPPGTALPTHPVPLTQALPVCLSPSDVLTVFGQTNGTEHTLVTGILTSFSLKPASAQDSYPLHLAMTFRLQVPEHPTEVYSQQCDLYSRTGQ